MFGAVTTTTELDCALADFLAGRIDVHVLCTLHGRWYMALAFDAATGSGEFDTPALRRRDPRLRIHLDIAEQIASLVCTDEEATQPEFIRCGRIGATEATRRVRELCA